MDATLDATEHGQPLPDDDSAEPQDAGLPARHPSRYADLRNPALGSYLFELLETTPLYRHRWEREIVRRRSRGVSHAAVARVLADHLVTSGERSVWDEGIGRSLKDRVSRAADGRLSAETLRWFTEAFSMSGEHSRALWGLFNPRRKIPNAPLVPGALRCGRIRAGHAVLELGPNGAVLRERVLSVVQVDGERTDRYVRRFPIAAAAVEVLRGGRLDKLGRGPSGLSEAEIVFSPELAPGATAALEYVAHFADSPYPIAEYRWTSIWPVANLELRIQLPRASAPRPIRWAEWDARSGELLREEPLRLDLEHGASRFLEQLGASAVGFRWER